jgi:hypothetical protein
MIAEGIVALREAVHDDAKGRRSLRRMASMP